MHTIIMSKSAEIYIGKSGLVLGPYYLDEVRKRLDDDRLDGTELAWHEGLDERVKQNRLESLSLWMRKFRSR